MTFWIYGGIVNDEGLFSKGNVEFWVWDWIDKIHLTLEKWPILKLGLHDMNIEAKALKLAFCVSCVPFTSIAQRTNHDPLFLPSPKGFHP